MAIPWYTSELPLNSLNLNINESRFASEENLNHSPDVLEKNNNKNNPIIDLNHKNGAMWSLNSVRKVIVKSNNLFKVSDHDVDKISELEEIDKDHENNEYHLFHTGLINRAFFIQRIILIIIGRWPLAMRLKQVSSKKHRKKFDAENKFKHHYSSMRVRNFDGSLKTPLWIYFGLTTLFVSYVLVMSTIGFFDFFLEWKLLPCCQWSANHKTIFRDNLVIFLLVWASLLHVTMSSLSFLVHRKRVARILNYWNVAADELLVEDVRKPRRFLVTANVAYLFFLVLIYFGYSAFRIPIVRDGAELFGTITVRPFLTTEQLDNPVEEWQWKLRVFGIVIIIYAIYASRSFLFLFCFLCRILRGMFKVWNTRLVRFLKRPEFNTDDEKDTRDIIEKMESQRLLSDMTILLKLVKKMEKMFSLILQAYYAVQLLNMCFELYMLAKIGTKEFSRSNESNRGLDIITAVLTLCQNVYFFFTVSLDGADVGEEAAKGVEALRRHAIRPNSGIYRKYLIYNLGFIYNHRIAITGGKYFTLDRPFIIAVLGAVLTYFVIILQVGPSFQSRFNVTESS